ncbi:MAG: hypothetical protein ABI193_04740 [Minicystis sp.]
MAEPVTALLRRALHLVETRAPAAHAAMVTSLDGLDISVSVEDTLRLSCAGGAFAEEPPDGAAAIRLRTDRATIRALLTGKTTLNTSIRSGAIELAGAAQALGRGLAAFEYFVCALLGIDEAEELGREMEGE